MQGAANLPSLYGIRALTYSTLFGLIAVTGLRVSEATSLSDADVDLVNGVITVRRGKFGKVRILPISETTSGRLAAYAKERDRLLGGARQAFFVSERDTRINRASAWHNFAIVCQHIGLRAPQRYGRHGSGPRIHDLRHTFSARTIVNWYRAGLNPRQEMIKLSTYLGHGRPEDTYWYIEAVPELLSLAAERASARLAQEEWQ